MGIITHLHKKSQLVILFALIFTKLSCVINYLNNSELLLAFDANRSFTTTVSPKFEVALANIHQSLQRLRLRLSGANLNRRSEGSCLLAVGFG